MTEIEAITDAVKEEDEKDDEDSIYSDPNGELNFLLLITNNWLNLFFKLR